MQDPIIQYIQTLADSKVITPEQSRSFKKAIKNTVKEHTSEHAIERVMIDELIQLYTSLNLIDEDETFYLKMIQSNRYGIHSFQNRSIGTWNDLQYATRFLCYFMERVMNHLPDIPDIEY